MAKYLISGGAGFIGSQLANSLLNDGHDVVVLDDLSTGSRAALHTGIELRQGSVLDSKLVDDCMHGVDGCFHLAAKRLDDSRVESGEGSHQTNLIGSINILHAACQYKTPVVYASSATVYGDNADIRLRENARPRPLTPVGANKLAVELHAKIVSMQRRIPTTGLRFFNVYGRREKDVIGRGSVVECFVDQLRRGEVVTIFGDGEQIRDFVYIDDAVRFLQRAMENDKPVASVYNVCTGEPVSISQLARSVMAILDLQLPVVYEAARAADIRGYVGDPSLASKELGISTRFSIADGLFDWLHPRPVVSDNGYSLGSLRDQSSSQACFLR